MSHARVHHELLDPHRNVHTLVYTSHEACDAPDPHKDFDDTVCRAIGRLLHDAYRGHDWQVWVSREAGIAKIWIALLMDPTVPYVVKLEDLHQPQSVINAGGELLERFNIPRSCVDFGLVADIRKTMGPLLGRIVAPGGHIKGL
jgi:hypothetical protein